ncbi:MAG: PDZ domain-containing protein [Verrucomicrobiae bacterium]|nr:PDZ domain-containing protein [Verrucomicrobiae bacterium]
MVKRRFVWFLLLTATLCATGHGQEVSDETLPGKRIEPDALSGESLHQVERLNGSVVTSVFARVTADRSQSIVPIVTTNGKLVVLSVAVASNGYVVSKASELEEMEIDRLIARVPSHGPVAVKMVQMQKKNDLALLKVDAQVVPIEWAASTTLKTGFIVGAQSNASGAMRVGIVSAAPRPIEREGGVIGVLLEQRIAEPDKSGALVTHVFEGSGAAASDMKSGDVILSVAGRKVDSPQAVTEMLSAFDVGESVAIVLEHRIGGKITETTVEVTLGYRRSVGDRQDRNQVLSGASSNRRAGFENVIQHDIPVGPEAMGGVLFTLEGKAVGMNIARRDRVTTYALPSEVVQRVARDMIAVELGAAKARAGGDEQSDDL